MAEDREALVQKTYRLPAAVVEFIEGLRGKSIFGHTDSAVVRALLEQAISNLVSTEYVRKHAETMRLLGEDAATGRRDRKSTPK